MGLGSGIRDPGSGIGFSRILGSKWHRIPDPDPQHWVSQYISILFDFHLRTFLEFATKNITESQKHLKIFLDFLKYEEDFSLSAYLKCGFAHNVGGEREGRIATGQIISRNKILTIKVSLVFCPMKD
jgi:hypothetical protein